MSKKIKKLYPKIRKNFITGLITLIPLFATYIFFKWSVKFLYNQFSFIPQKLFPNNFAIQMLFNIGIILFLFLIIYLIGILANHYFGRQLFQIVENLLKKIPVISNIYSGTKQIIDSFSLTKKRKFLDVVLAEYPRKGCYSIGFVTGIIDFNKTKLLKIFVPSTPNPTTGYLIYLKKSDVKYLDISVETALKLILSGGIIEINKIKIKK